MLNILIFNHRWCTSPLVKHTNLSKTKTDQQVIYKPEQISSYVNYIVLYQEIVRKFFNYSGTFLVLQLWRSCLLQIRSPWVVTDGGARSKHAAQPFWNSVVSWGYTCPHATACIKNCFSLRSREVKIPIEIEINSIRRLSFFSSDRTLSFCHIWGLSVLSHTWSQLCRVHKRSTVHCVLWLG